MNYLLPFLQPAPLIFVMILNILLLILLVRKNLANNKLTAQLTDKNIIPSKKEKREFQSEIHQIQAVPDNSEEKLKYEAILSSIGEGLIVTDKTGHIITFNKAAESMLGWSAKEAIGKVINDIIKIDYKNNHDKSKSKFTNQPSLYFLRKDKTEFPAAITDTSYIQGANILGTITLFRDITYEQNIDQMKNEFISLASHQLRTPLSAIKWYTEMLINGDVGKLLAEQMEYMKIIYSSTQRMIHLVNSLLNISRIESGRINIEPRPTDVKKLAEEILQEVKIHFADKKKRLNLNVVGSLPLISLDPQLIRQVYLNLLTNAVKYTPEKGEISVTISKKDAELLTQISDNGYGIPESEKNRVFSKFYRGDNITGRVNEGTGLGLYLVKSIIELSQGKIGFDSKEGTGTIFWFSLPIAGTPPKKGVVSLSS